MKVWYKMKRWIFDKIIVRLFKDEIDDIINYYENLVCELDEDLSEAYAKIEALEQEIAELEYLREYA